MSKRSDKKLSLTSMTLPGEDLIKSCKLAYAEQSKKYIEEKIVKPFEERRRKRELKDEAVDSLLDEAIKHGQTESQLLKRQKREMDRLKSYLDKSYNETRAKFKKTMETVERKEEEIKRMLEDLKNMS